MSDKIYNALFLCTGNSVRSIMAECILRRWAPGRFRGFSAGSHPTGEINPHVLEILKRTNFKTDDLRSKSWDEFAVEGAPELDFVFTVCDRAEGEVCPVWPGQPISAHWGCRRSGHGHRWIRKAFLDAFLVLEARIKLFTALPMESLDRLSLKKRLSQIGRERPATS